MLVVSYLTFAFASPICSVPRRCKSSRCFALPLLGLAHLCPASPLLFRLCSSLANLIVAIPSQLHAYGSFPSPCVPSRGSAPQFRSLCSHRPALLFLCFSLLCFSIAHRVRALLRYAIADRRIVLLCPCRAEHSCSLAIQGFRIRIGLCRCFSIVRCRLICRIRAFPLRGPHGRR